MPKLPDSTSLGQRPIPESRRNVVGYRTDIEADAVGDLANTVSRIGTQYQERQDRLESAYAESAFVRGNIEAMNLDDDDYTTYPQRYQEQMNKVLSSAASKISNPNQRKLFEANASTSIAKGLAQVQERSKEKERDFGRANQAEFVNQTIDAALKAPDEETQARLILSLNDSFHGMVDRNYMTAEEAAKARLNTLENYGVAKFQSLPASERLRILDRGKQSTGFDKAIQVVMKNEGGFTPSDGASGAPAIYGLNAKWHPQAYAEAKRLTDEQGEAVGKAYAQDYYKKVFWETNGLEQLPEEVQGVVLDGVINHRITFGKQLVEAAISGATSEQLINMRKAEYDRLKNADPKYAESYKGWMNRLKEVENASLGKRGDFTDFIPQDKRLQLAEQAKNDLRREQVVWRADLESRVKDSIAMASVGAVDTAAPTLDDFRRAYDEDEAATRYSEYADTRKLGENLNRVRQLTPIETESLLKEYTPKPGDGFADQQREFDILRKAVAETSARRKKDPIGFALENNLTPYTEPLTFGVDFAAEMRRRNDTAQTMRFTYGTPVRAFSEAEVEQFKEKLSSAKPEEQLAFVGGIYEGFGTNTLEALEQIAPKDKVFAHYAGLYAINPDRGQTVALDAFRGRAMLAENPKAKPSESDTLFEFRKTVGNALQYMPGAESALLDAATALYVKRAYDKGSIDTFDSSLFQQAIHDAMGAADGDVAITAINNRLAVLPAGVTSDQFEDFLSRLTPEDSLNYSMTRTAPIDKYGRQIRPEVISEYGEFVTVGNGQYKVKMPDGFVKTGDGTQDYILTVTPDAVNKVLRR